MTNLEQFTANYHANGKLLLTGEYLVMHGANALALPLKFGQSLTVTSTTENSLEWQVYSPKGLWWSAKFDNHLNLLTSSDELLAQRLKSILHETLKLTDKNCRVLTNLKATFHLQFNPEWGFGSSSTLMALLGQWLNINPYELLSLTFKGSGYDVAAALSNQPIIYQTNGDFTPTIIPVDFNPPFRNNLIFFYLGHKKVSSNEVKKFSQVTPPVEVIEQMNVLTSEFCKCTNLNDFQGLILRHEELISNYINQPSINETIKIDGAYFKSLGGWGGDFALCATNNVPETRTKLHELGYTTLFTYNELVIS